MPYDAKIVTREALISALERTSRNREESASMAEYLLSFFGFNDSIADNGLEAHDRDVFYMLEESGLLRTDRDETTIQKGRIWRIFYWDWNKEQIFSNTLETVVAVQEKEIYSELPNNAWEREPSEVYFIREAFLKKFRGYVLSEDISTFDLTKEQMQSATKVSDLIGYFRESPVKLRKIWLNTNSLHSRLGNELPRVKELLIEFSKERPLARKNLISAMVGMDIRYLYSSPNDFYRESGADQVKGKHAPSFYDYGLKCSLTDKILSIVAEREFVLASQVSEEIIQQRKTLENYYPHKEPALKETINTMLRNLKRVGRISSTLVREDTSKIGFLYCLPENSPALNDLRKEYMNRNTVLVPQNFERVAMGSQAIRGKVWSVLTNLYDAEARFYSPGEVRKNIEALSSRTLFSYAMRDLSRVGAFICGPGVRRPQDFSYAPFYADPFFFLEVAKSHTLEDAIHCVETQFQDKGIELFSRDVDNIQKMLSSSYALLNGESYMDKVSKVIQPLAIS